MSLAYREVEGRCSNAIDVVLEAAAHIGFAIVRRCTLEDESTS